MLGLARGFREAAGPSHVLANPSEQDRVLAHGHGVFDVALLVEEVEDLRGGEARVEADPKAGPGEGLPPPYGFVGHLIGAACPVEEEGVHDDEEGIAGFGGSPEGDRRSQRSAAGAGALLGESERWRR